jgi:hypothetical protein
MKTCKKEMAYLLSTEFCISCASFSHLIVNMKIETDEDDNHRSWNGKKYACLKETEDLRGLRKPR